MRVAVHKNILDDQPIFPEWWATATGVGCIQDAVEMTEEQAEAWSAGYRAFNADGTSTTGCRYLNAGTIIYTEEDYQYILEAESRLRSAQMAVDTLFRV